MEERIFFWWPAKVTPTRSRSLQDKGIHEWLAGCQLHVTTETHVQFLYVLGVELRHHVQAGEASLQEVLLVPLHLYGPQPLGHRGTGGEGWWDSLVQQGVGWAGGGGETGRQAVSSRLSGLTVCLSICLLVCLTVCICPSVRHACLYLCLSVYLSV